MIKSAPVNVRDYGATGDGTTNDTTAVQAALTAAKAGSKVLYFPKGNYLVEEALYLDRGLTVYGDGIASTGILRTSLSPTSINGNNIYAVFYVEGGWNHISDMSVSGVAGSTTGTVNGIQFGANIAAKGSIKNMAINYMLNAIIETAGVFLTTFDNIQAVSCGYGFMFTSTSQKTSLTLNQCYAANTGSAYVMKFVDYSVIQSCAADNCNWGTTSGNPYGTGYGDPASGIGIYHFDQCDVTITHTGAEGSYGNGVFSMQNSFITINDMFSYDCRSRYVPNYASYPNYAVGPIQCTTAPNRITVNNAYNRVWTNEVVASVYPSKPIADLVAFNYDESSIGVYYGTQVFLATNAGGSPTVKGMGPINRNVVSSYNPQGNYQSIVQTYQITGTGTKIRLPMTTQGVQNYKHLVKLKGFDGTFNSSNPLPFEATFAFGGTTSPLSVTSTDLWNVSSVAAAGSGSAVEITLSASRTNPFVSFEIVSEKINLVDALNASIS
jgi:hypothetical protein